MKPTRAIVIILLLAAMVLGFLFLPVRQWFMHFESYVQSLGAIGPVVVAAAYILCTVLFIPGSAITVGAGTLFGLKLDFSSSSRTLAHFLLFCWRAVFCDRTSSSGRRRIRNFARWIRRSASKASRWFCSRV